MTDHSLAAFVRARYAPGESETDAKGARVICYYRAGEEHA